MAGDADRRDEALVLGSDRTLERAARTGPPIEIVERAHRVELDQVDAIDAEPIEGSPDAVVGGARRLVAGLGREEDPVSDPRHPHAEARFCVAVVRRRVEVVDAGLKGELDRSVGDLLRDVAERRAAVDQHAAHVFETTEPATLHHVRVWPFERAPAASATAAHATTGIVKAARRPARSAVNPNASGPRIDPT